MPMKSSLMNVLFSISHEISLHNMRIKINWLKCLRE